MEVQTNEPDSKRTQARVLVDFVGVVLHVGGDMEVGGMRQTLEEIVQELAVCPFEVDYDPTPIRGGWVASWKCKGQEFTIRRNGNPGDKVLTIHPLGIEFEFNELYIDEENTTLKFYQSHTSEPLVWDWEMR